MPRSPLKSFAPLPARAFRLDYWLVALFVIGGAALYALDWLARHPQHDPRAPLVLQQAEGWATPGKLAALRGDAQACRAVLERSGVAFDSFPAEGEGACLRADRVLPAADAVPGLAFSPARATATCGVHAGLAWWLDHRVQPAADAILGSEVVRIEQLGTASCRRVNNASEGRWSEHATGNAIDIAGFVLADGRRISVLRDWQGDDADARFLRAARDGACDVFGTTLSPDYNALHADHLHLDQAQRGMGGFCR